MIYLIRNKSHTSIIEALIEDIKTRKLDEFHGIETTFLKGGKLDGEDSATMAALLGDKSGGITALDKARLMLIYAGSQCKLY